MNEIESFLQNWGEDSLEVKEIFTNLYRQIKACPALKLEWRARPEISYTLLARREKAAQEDETLFAVLDIVDDDPEERWLSLRLDAALVHDPAGLGEVLPGGLGQSSRADAWCIDLDENEEDLPAYLHDLLAGSLIRL